MPSDLRQQLLARIERKYRLRATPIQFADRTIPFTRIADPNRVLDELADREDRREKKEGRRREGEELHLPYWAELWDSALGLCELLLEDQQSIRGKTFLDLGCGMGLIGTVAAAVGAQVTLADLEADALLLARLNAMQFNPAVFAQRVNWRTDRLDRRFDWIVGADIIYEKAQWEFLDLFWRDHLGDGRTLLLGEPFRPTGDQFIEWARDHNWDIEVSERIVRIPFNIERSFSPVATRREWENNPSRCDEAKQTTEKKIRMLRIKKTQP